MSEVVSSAQPTLKVALGIEYDGSRYYGWQRQQEVASVQERLEQALPGAPTPGCTPPGRWCISKPPRVARTPPGRWA